MTTDQETPRASARVLHMSASVDATPEQVWRALTDPDELVRWFPLRSGGTPGLGGKVLLNWGEEWEWWTSITAWEPHEHLQWTDQQVPGGPSPLVVDWYIATEKGKTVVRGVHSGFGSGADWDAMYDGLEGGWTYFMRGLRHYLDRHAGTRRDMVHVRRKTGVPTGAVWERLRSPMGLDMRDGRMRFAGEDGVVEHAKPGERIWGPLAGLNDALLFVEFEGGGDAHTVGIWLSTYGLPASRVTALQREMDALGERVLGA